jgi:hypothetical protein
MYKNMDRNEKLLLATLLALTPLVNAGPPEGMVR